MKYTLLSFSVTIVLYLFISFVEANLFWISDVFKWERDFRMQMVFGFVIKEIITILGYFILKSEKYI